MIYFNDIVFLKFRKKLVKLLRLLEDKMFLFWMFLFFSQPYLLILGFLGVFGKEAKEVAEIVCIMIAGAVAFLAAGCIVIFLLNSLLKLFGAI